MESNVLTKFGYSDFVNGKLPSHLAVIRRCNREVQKIVNERGTSHNFVTSNVVAKRVAPALMEHWVGLNPLLAPPVTFKDKSVYNKVLKLFNRARESARKLMKSKDQGAFESSLDELFDICSCQHTIHTCQDNSSGDFLF